MGHGTMDRGESSGVSASKLAAMGMCERRVALDHRHGRKVSAAQHEALQRGLRLHAAFDAQAAAERPGRRGRCFIATHIFGSAAPQTEVLRRYRDGVLRTSGPGCRLIVWYYRAAPLVCAWLCRHPWACIPLRHALSLMVWYAGWRCRRMEVHHVR